VLANRATAPEILVVAGEASGDLHGATLARALRVLAPDLRLHGLGGPQMEEAGVRLLERMDRLAVVGGTEALRRLPALWRTLAAVRRRLTRAGPRALVLIDFPEFNFRLTRDGWGSPWSTSFRLSCGPGDEAACAPWPGT